MLQRFSGLYLINLHSSGSDGPELGVSGGIVQHKTLDMLYHPPTKSSQSSKVVDLLTTSAWSLFQKRIGDDIMVRLLKFVSIFLPLEHGDHHQVSGFPISDFCSKFSKDINAPAFQHPLPDSSELSKKKKRKNDEDKFNLDVEILTQPSLGYDGSASYVNHHVGYNQRNDIGGWSLQMSTSVAIIPSTCSASDKKDISSESLQRIDKENTNSKKRTRLFSWQRCKRCRQLNFGEVSQRNHVGQCSGQGITSDTNFPSTCIANIRSKSGRGCLQKTNKKNANSKNRARPFSWEHCKRCRRLSFAVVLTAHTDTTDYTETLNMHNISIGSFHHSVETVHLQESKKKAPFSFWICTDPNDSSWDHFMDFDCMIPWTNILNTSKTSDTGAMHVFKDIFGITDENLVFMSMRSEVFHSLRKLLKCLLHQVRICHYSKLMDKHYTVEALEMSTMGEAEPMLKVIFGGNLSCLCENHVLLLGRSIVPLELVGAPSNWRALRRNISKFVHLRKFENFSLKQFVPIVQSSFYVTEVEGGKLDMFYYRKPTWEKMSSKAFHSVNQDKLLFVMKDVMLNEEYLLQFSSEVICTKKCLWVHYGQKLLDPTMGTATMKSAPSVPFRVLHRVLTNQETSKMVWKAQLYQDLYQHVKWNMLLLEKQFYLQEVGIPQGSTVSSLLCSYYYAHMERNVIFPFLEKIQEPHTSKSAKTNLSGELICQSNGPTEKDEEQNTPTGPEHALLRFISTSKEQATSFFTRLQRGFRDYSCFINE
ncbi:hypothetical protein IFM89_004374 [Coptis chinensis]|uniref:Telomerase reverse transcriptase n=1 Tax=Coptis chinensis TaxID=261450 RepID=A0A835M4N1_9MAGN|nr:hypothetical protein IFM89_004374 [Coptis chinensis]